MSTGARYSILAAALFLIGGAIFYLDDAETGVSKQAEIKAGGESSIMKDMMYPRAKEIVKPSGFVNTGEAPDGRGQPVKIADYIGKEVVLIDFLTYSCINCVRVQPYLNAWHDKYAGKGLQIIGIHTPEFEFEKEYANVARAMKEMGVKYPVVLDNEYGTWSAYQNRYWPRKFLIDLDGYIVYDHIGEGGYEETERKIQELLQERMARLGLKDGISADLAAPSGTEGVADRMPRTPEIYFGALRNGSYLGAGQDGSAGARVFTAPAEPQANVLYLDGRWTITPEYAEGQEGSRVLLRYQAQKVFMVASAEQGAEVSIHVDGRETKRVHIAEDELYRLIEDEAWGEHTLEIFVEKGSPRLFTFTFG